MKSKTYSRPDDKRRERDLRRSSPSTTISSDLAATFAQALAFHKAGLLAEAEALYRKVIAIHPHHFDSLHLLGVICHQRGNHAEAIRQIDAALKRNSNSASAHCNRGSALQSLDRLDEALASFDRALALRPGAAEVLFNRGNVLQSLGRREEALASFDAAITARLDYADAFVNRGGALQQLERWDDALASYDQALTIKPDFAQAHNSRGATLKALGRLEEAVASYGRAIALRSDYAEAFHNRGIALRDLQRFAEAVADFDRAMAFKFRDRYLRGSRLHAKMHICDWSNLDAEMSDVISAVKSGVPASLPLPFVAIPTSPEDQRKCSELYVADRFPAAQIPLWQGERYAHDRVRIAYLSTDYHDHAVMQLMAGLFESHDRARFETTAMSLAPCKQDHMRKRLEPAFDRFLDVQTMNDHKVAELVRELEIDIAIDLNGFTRGARSAIFLKRPAPVQVNYLGYPGTLGSSCWDYIIADRLVIPEDCHAQYAEKVVYLPESYMANDVARKISPRTPSRAEAGLPDNGFVFCCFNNPYKITPDIFDVWMRLLHQAEGSVLWLSGANPGAVENLRREAYHRGVSPERLIFALKVWGMEDHLARLRLADLFLDTLYYNAFTTASDALWAGVPVVTCPGATYASRGAGSLLNGVGLPELITASLAEYEALALALVRNTPRFSAIKQRLARNREKHPLFDTPRFARHLEAAYITMWERYQRGSTPESFSVPAID
jgi:predicted O-linked N-acetylglucosamine transferase (SPINDLY family)